MDGWRLGLEMDETERHMYIHSHTGTDMILILMQYIE
jgi:hypothetical protein